MKNLIQTLDRIQLYNDEQIVKAHGGMPGAGRGFALHNNPTGNNYFRGVGYNNTVVLEDPINEDSAEEDVEEEIKKKKRKKGVMHTTIKSADDDDSSDDDNDPSTKTFPPTEATKSLYTQLQSFGDQAYVVAEILNQIEGYKNLNDMDNANNAIAALRSALSDIADMQTSVKKDLLVYINSIDSK